MENKKSVVEPRITINIKKSLADKFDMLRFGKESWNQLLEAIYPMVAQSRKHIFEDKLKNLEEESKKYGG